MTENTNASGFTQGDHVTLTRTPAGVGNPATLTVSGKLTSLVIKDGQLSGGTIQAPNGPVILDLDADRMMRLYGVTQTLRKLEAQPQSGYTPCVCRDCMDDTVSNDTTSPELCSECEDAGCSPWGDGEPKALDGSFYQCQRDDAYGA